MNTGKENEFIAIVKLEFDEDFYELIDNTIEKYRNKGHDVTFETIDYNTSKIFISKKGRKK